MGDFDGKVALVTGAAGGIGRAAAIGFAREGARVVAADIDTAGLAETVELAGIGAIAVQVDVSDEHSCQSMVAEAVSAFGRLDVLFNNAGIAGNRANTADTSTEDWNRVISINLTGVFFCARAVIPEMLKAGGGVIINTASVDGLVGMPSVAHYVAAKHGVIGLTKSLALEYTRDNIRTVAVAPGYIKTNMTKETFTEEEKVMLASLVPMGRPAAPEEVANMVLWLASDKASYVSGSVHTVDAGLLAGFNLPG
jgi:NAD(P)-dependent dehydrogenase (short-subunit alcohol dehydrogenase family)